MPSFWSRNGRLIRRTERQGRKCRSTLWHRKWRLSFWKRRRNRRLWRSSARRNSAPIRTDDLGGAGLQGCRPVPLFSFSRKRRDCRFRLHKGRKPRLSLQSRDNSVREPNAQPAPATGLFKGFGVYPNKQRNRHLAATPDVCFVHLYIQMPCLPSSGTSIFAALSQHFSKIYCNFAANML